MHHKESLEKEKEIVLHQHRQMPNIINFFRRPKINNSNLSNEKQRT